MGCKTTTQSITASRMDLHTVDSAVSVFHMHLGYPVPSQFFPLFVLSEKLWDWTEWPYTCPSPSQQSQHRMQAVSMFTVRLSMLWMCLTADMLLVLWHALVVQVSRLLEVADATCAKSDRVDVFMTMMSTLRLVVTNQQLQPTQLLVSSVCAVALVLYLMI